MKFAICVNAVSSVYKEATVHSEQLSQLLFGEVCSIISVVEDYIEIENCLSKASGWVVKSSMTLIEEGDVKQIINQPLFRVCMPFADVFKINDRSVVKLPAGSIIPNYNPENSKFVIGGVDYQIHSSFVTYLPHGNIDGIKSIALAFQNTPFVQGGKTVLGMDSLGFIHLVYSLCGISLPSSKRELTSFGESVLSLSKALAGDLLFFENKNVDLNLFIYLGDNKAIGMDSTIEVVDIMGDDFSRSSCIIRRLV